MNYLVRILPNDIILVINQETRERKVLKPREVGKFFEEELAPSIKEWDKVEENMDNMQDELSKL